MEQIEKLPPEAWRSLSVESEIRRGYSRDVTIVLAPKCGDISPTLKC